MCIRDSFYTAISFNPVELSQNIKDQWNGLNFKHVQFLSDVGLSTPAGEKGRLPLEMIWSRPTCEINGLWGGYIDEGFKTVIPSKAHAKISFRLVGQQDPENIRIEFRKKLRKELPTDFEISFSNHKGSKATQFDCNSKIMTEAKKALTDEWGRETVFVGGGGSIPIVKHFKEILDMDTLLVGFSLDNDQILSPNE